MALKVEHVHEIFDRRTTHAIIYYTWYHRQEMFLLFFFHRKTHDGHYYRRIFIYLAQDVIFFKRKKAQRYLQKIFFVIVKAYSVIDRYLHAMQATLKNAFNGQDTSHYLKKVFIERHRLCL